MYSRMGADMVGNKKQKDSLQTQSPLQTVLRHWRRPIIALALSAPLLVLVLALIKTSVNVPFWDQWELVPLYEKLRQGTLTFSDFFAQHNEHRILFPRFIMAGLAVFTAWNVLYEVAVNVLLAVAVFGVLWLLIKHTFTQSRIRIAAAFVLSLILFSPIQFENWMWGWQIQWFLNVLGLAVSVWALWAWRAKEPWLKLGVAAIAAAIATYSLASGFFVWLVCLPLVLFAKDLRKFWPAWVGAAILVVGSHYIGYVDPAYHPSKLIFLKEPLQFTTYFLVYVGRPLVVDFLVSVPVTLLYLLTFALGLVRVAQKHLREITTTLLPWLCLGLYGLLAAASTAVSRLGLGIEQAYSNRYITLSNLILISGVILAFKLVEHSTGKTLRAVRMGGITILTAVVLVLSVNYYKGLAQMQEREIHLKKVQHCAQTATSAEDDCLLLLYPNKEVVWPRLQYLRSIHWGGL